MRDLTTDLVHLKPPNVLGADWIRGMVRRGTRTVPRAKARSANVSPLLLSQVGSRGDSNGIKKRGRVGGNV